MPTTTVDGKTLSTVDLTWNEVYFTNCPMVSANNVDQELGGARRTSRRSGSTTRSSAAAARTTSTRTTSTTSTT